MKNHSITFKTRFGWISALEKNGKIYEIKFKKIKNNNPSILLSSFRINIKKYFLKKTKIINFPIKLEGTKNQKNIWYEIKKIKFGKKITYGAIAKKLNLSPRLVGKVCGQNNLLLLIPCHRVIRSDGNLGGFSAKGGILLKKKLLKLESE